MTWARQWEIRASTSDESCALLSRMPSTEHVVCQQPAICRYVPPLTLSVSCVSRYCLSVSCPECDRRSLLVGLSAVPPSDSRAQPVVPARNPAPHLRRLSLRA